MNEKHKEKNMLIRLQTSLFELFKTKCDSNYKTMSEVIRDFMVNYIRDKK